MSAPAYKNAGKGRNGGTLGSPGRPKGAVAKTTRVLKDAILLAAVAVGENGRGKGELVGYLTFLARREPKSFAALLGRVLPLQITGRDGGPVQVQDLTREQVLLQLRERGIPVDQLLLPSPADEEIVDADFRAVEEERS